MEPVAASLKLKTLNDNPYYNLGKIAGKAEALGGMGTPCTNCPSIEVTKGDKTIKLYNPEKVEFKKE